MKTIKFAKVVGIRVTVMGEGSAYVTNVEYTKLLDDEYYIDKQIYTDPIPVKLYEGVAELFHMKFEGIELVDEKPGKNSIIPIYTVEIQE